MGKNRFIKKMTTRKLQNSLIYSSFTNSFPAFDMQQQCGRSRLVYNVRSETQSEHTDPQLGRIFFAHTLMIQIAQPNHKKPPNDKILKSGSFSIHGISVFISPYTISRLIPPSRNE
jgi:hypothetical protein